MNDQEKIIETLREDINLKHAPQEALEELAANAKRIFFEKGSYVFRAGDESEFFYIVESGRVVLSKEAPSGKVFTYLIAVRGVPLNAVTCFKASPRLFSARVAEPTSIIAIPCTVFRYRVLRCPEVTAGILSWMGDMLDGAYTRILDIIDESAEVRILNALTMLSSRIGKDLPLTNNDVAEMTGISRETAARVISRLQEADLISKSRGTIEILDELRLKELSTSPFFIL
ncbi:Crp/Fnr family transcriptional regulator [Maridesulfovibrio sp.]|uniref:Crp/Fnr family transcriptional regulator n=1 Tax=Maridesulfovibrio sp. TaxID=2795000 RepID=UPI002A18A05C|nr:Crp/Fnr family transcriptional regulator [Maridesulfovibrio sp.]